MSREALRLRNYRAFNSLVKNIKLLKEHKELSEKQSEWLLKKATNLYQKLKAEFRAKNRNSHKKRGRPRNPRRHEIYATCKKVGCSNRSMRDQAYCCKEHAPFSSYITHELEA